MHTIKAGVEEIKPYAMINETSKILVEVLKIYC